MQNYILLVSCILIYFICIFKIIWEFWNVFVLFVGDQLLFIFIYHFFKAYSTALATNLWIYAWSARPLEIHPTIPPKIKAHAWVAISVTKGLGAQFKALSNCYCNYLFPAICPIKLAAWSCIKWIIIDKSVDSIRKQIKYMNFNY